MSMSMTDDEMTMTTQAEDPIIMANEAEEKGILDYFMDYRYIIGSAVCCCCCLIMIIIIIAIIGYTATRRPTYGFNDTYY